MLYRQFTSQKGGSEFKINERRIFLKCLLSEAEKSELQSVIKTLKYGKIRDISISKLSLSYRLRK